MGDGGPIYIADNFRSQHWLIAFSRPSQGLSKAFLKWIPLLSTLLFFGCFFPPLSFCCHCPYCCCLCCPCLRCCCHHCHCLRYCCLFYIVVVFVVVVKMTPIHWMTDCRYRDARAARNNRTNIQISFLYRKIFELIFLIFTTLCS